MAVRTHQTGGEWIFSQLENSTETSDTSERVHHGDIFHLKDKFLIKNQ